jgi:hypothetical protein
MRITNVAAVLLAAGALTACGGGGGSAAPDVASLDDESATTGTAAESSDDEPTPEDREEALLEFAQCMRDHGIDMPDPQISEDGNGGILVQRQEGRAGIDPESEEFRAAAEECEPILEDGMGAIELDPEQQAEMQERLLEFAECMRDHGIDMPDPVFGEDGRVEIQANAPDSGGDPLEDDDFQAAQEECNEDGGVFGRGPGAGGGPAGETDE